MVALNEKFVAVTNRHLCNVDFLSQIEVLCQTEIQAIILREKDLSQEEYFNLAKKVQEISLKHSKKLILHSFPEVAIELNCGAIHLPFSVFLETDIAQLKKSIPEIGTSVHSLEDAVIAEKKGATYITAGHIFLTDCKKGLPARGLDFLKQVCCQVKIPVFAIGGINESNIDSVLAAGAKAGCVMSGAMI